MNAVYNLGLKDEKYYGKARKWKPVDFVGHRKIFFAIAIVFILVGPVTMLVRHAQGTNALNYSLEFMGGTSTTVTFNKEYSIEELEQEVQPYIEEVTGDANIQMQRVTGSNQVVIKTRALSMEEREELETSLTENFGIDASNIATESISATVSNEMRNDAVTAIVIAILLMLVYIWFRFSDVRFATSAVLALSHDVLVVLGCYAVMWISVGNTFIACMLTIVGYSVNATIVIFDRIREHLHTMGKNDKMEDLVNTSITQTLTRSIYTSLTTFVTVAVLYILGVSSIREFALPLMTGILCGAFSSVCITGPLWYVMRTKLQKKK